MEKCVAKYPYYLCNRFTKNTNIIFVYEILGASVYCLSATANMQPWNESSMSVGDQIRFEKDQLLFKDTTKYYTKQDEHSNFMASSQLDEKAIK